MVFAQSFWSKPFLNLDSNDVNYRSAGGFIDKRYFYYCWVMSFLHLASMGEKIVLFTDDVGKYLLVDILGLEYSGVRLDFNELEELSSAYWAIPKLVTYSRLKEPFLHVDGDILLYPGFKNLGLEKRALVFEFKNCELNAKHVELINSLDSIVIHETLEGEFAELNCGVVGGTDYKFFNDFAEFSLGLFYNCLDELDTGELKYNKNVINSYFEQFLVYQYVYQRGKEFSCLFEYNPTDTYSKDFFLPRSNRGRIMTHFLMNLKSKFSCEIEMAVRLDYPVWHRKINDLIGQNVL